MMNILYFEFEFTMKNNKLSDEMIRYFKLCAPPSLDLSNCTSATRLYHDLDIWGEDAEDYMLVLMEEFHVDLTDFEFDKYFPPESPGKTTFTMILNCFFPFIKIIQLFMKKPEYSPVTIGLLERAIKEKRWPRDVGQPNLT